MANLMPTYWQDRAFVANGAITEFTVVSLSTDDSDGNARVATTANATTQPIGVAQETVADGATVRVRVQGETLVSANAGYSAGDELAVAASDGEVDTHAASAGVGNYVVGIAMEAAGAGQEHRLMRLQIYFKQTND